MQGNKPLLERIRDMLAPKPLALTPEEHAERIHVWGLARRGYNYPALGDPLYYEKLDGGAFIDMRNCQVHMGEAVINDLIATGKISETDARAMLQSAMGLGATTPDITADATHKLCQLVIEWHELGHYMVFPHNLATTLFAGKVLDDFFKNSKHPQIQDYIFQLYADTANDTASVLTPTRREGVLAMRSAFQSTEQCKTDAIVRELLLSYLYHQAGEKFTITPALQKDFSELHPEAEKDGTRLTLFEKWSKKMLEVDFLNRSPHNMRMSLYVFGNLIEEILDKFPPPKQKKQGGNQQGQGSPQQGKGSKGEKQEGEGEGEEEGEQEGKGKGKGEGAEEGEDEGGQGQGKGGKKNPLGNPTGMPQDTDAGDIIRKATREEIEGALRELSKDLTKAEIDRIKEWLGDKNPHKAQKKQSIGIGTSSGTLEVDMDTVTYYMEHSKNYPVIVATKPMILPDTKKSMSSTQRMRMGSDPMLIIPSSSGGRILPGITKSVRISERPKTTRKFDTPHLLIAIDSSGTQDHPANKKSMQVTSGVCAARSYHVHGSQIGVINFSGDSFYYEYTRDLVSACAAICAYQGGGTVVDVELIKTMLEKGNVKFGRGRSAEEIAEELKGKSMREIEELGLPRGAVRKSVELNHSSFEKALAGNDIDLLMFTDGGIANLRETLDFFEEQAQPNRATIILSGSYNFGEWFDYDSKTGKVKIIHVDKDSDIPLITIGQMKDNINNRATSGLLHRR